MRFLLCFALFELAGCDFLWGSYREPYPTNCITNPGICSAEEFCNTLTHVCEKATDGSVMTQDCSPGKFCVQPLPVTAGILNNVRALNAEAVWVVGYDGLIFQWNGAAWLQQQSGITTNLNAVWAASTTAVWAAGDSGKILRYDGQTWSPEVSNTSQHLFGLLGVDTSIFAVGLTGLVNVRDASSWTPQNPGGTHIMKDVFAASMDDVFIAADGGEIFRGSGTSWLPQMPPTAAGLDGIWGTDPNNVWASGTSGTILKWNGATWIRETSCTPHGLTGISGCDVNRVWAVGDAGSICFRNGSSTWVAQDSGTTVNLHKASAVLANGVCHLWVVGDAGVILHRQE